MADVLAAHDILLVSKCQSSKGDAINACIIQRGRGGVDHEVVDVWVNIAQAECLCPSFGRAGCEVLGRPEEPEETDEGQVDDVAVRLSFGAVLGVEDLVHVLDDGEVGRVSTFGGGFVASKAFAQSFEYGMEP